VIKFCVKCKYYCAKLRQCWRPVEASEKEYLITGKKVVPYRELCWNERISSDAAKGADVCGIEGKYYRKK
jgi:hypothetical protein